MFYYLYKITNVLNDKIYVGVHKTKNLDDGYMGSGKILRRAIEKHGLTNFSKDILEYFDTSEAMYAKEAEVVNEEFLLREDVYNLRRGGYGGFEYINNNNLNVFNIPSELSRYLGGKASGSSNLKAAHVAGKIRYDTFIGRTHSIETKIKIGITCSINQSGDKNSQFGMMWITNEVESKKIKNTDLIPDGYRKGRVSK